MKASDLRIGNIVYYKVRDELDERKEWNEINIVDAEDILSIEDYESKNQEHPYSPISLTEELLLQFGFERYLNRYHINDVFFVTKDLYWMNSEGFEDVELEFVHQLQNLYFALTGNELKYSPTKTS